MWLINHIQILFQCLWISSCSMEIKHARTNLFSNGLLRGSKYAEKLFSVQNKCLSLRVSVSYKSSKPMHLLNYYYTYTVIQIWPLYSTGYRLEYKGQICMTECVLIKGFKWSLSLAMQQPKIALCLWLNEVYQIKELVKLNPSQFISLKSDQ